MKHFFSALYGNEKTKNLIGRDIFEKKQHHAYILEGPTGSGKHILAREIAKALLCLREDAHTLPCNICPHCKKIDAQSHTDIAYVNSGDKASLAVETVRETLATLSYAPDEGNYKIYIFEDAEKMKNIGTAAVRCFYLAGHRCGCTFGNDSQSYCDILHAAIYQ